MNAGRDVERLISGWLVEEAPERAPDRILESTANRIDRTRQRRLRGAWGVPSFVPMRGLVLATAMGVGVAALGLIALNLSRLNGVGGPTTDSAASATLAAALIQDGTYIGPTLRGADIVASINSNPNLSDLERRDILENVLSVGEGQTFFVSIDIQAQPNVRPDSILYVVRQTVDGVTRVNVAGNCSFINGRLKVIDPYLAIDTIKVATTGDGFTLSVSYAQPTAANEAAAQILFESGPFTLVR